MLKSLITALVMSFGGVSTKSIADGLFDICYQKDHQRAQITAIVPQN